MALSDARRRANNKYIAKAYDQIITRVYKGQREQIQAHAESLGMSLNAYINKLIADDMGAALTVPPKPERQEQED